MIDRGTIGPWLRDWFRSQHGRLGYATMDYWLTATISIL